MGGDDNETNDGEGRPSPVLPPKALAVLAKARDAARADRARKDGRVLALVPLTIGILVLLLMMPRATLPDAVPVPLANERALRTIAEADDARAAAAEATRLPADVVLVGTALRKSSGAEARGADEVERIDDRRQLDAALRALGLRKDAAEDLISLRALQLRHFLDALSAWERTGAASEDFADLAASFVVRAETAGWVSGRQVLPDDAVRRVMFKTFWNALAGVDPYPGLALSLDEQRALFAFYIRHPHPPESSRLTLERERRLATTPETCARTNVNHSRQSAIWLTDKIRKLGEIDPSYPTGYALGVAYFQADRNDLAAESFNAFITTHPNGSFALRARNHLKALLLATSPR